MRTNSPAEKRTPRSLILATIPFPARRRTSLMEKAIDQKTSVAGVYGVGAVIINTNLAKFYIGATLPMRLRTCAIRSWLAEEPWRKGASEHDDDTWERNQPPTSRTSRLSGRRRLPDDPSWSAQPSGRSTPRCPVRGRRG